MIRQITEYALFEDMLIAKLDDGSTKVYSVVNNTIAALRKISIRSGVTINPEWDTRYISTGLIKGLRDKEKDSK